MSGYRQSTFDPNAGGDYGPPRRPYNWAQWTGVGFVIVGVVVDLVYLAGRLRIVPAWLDSPTLGIPLPLLGVALISSRRETIPSERLAEHRRKRRRWTIIAIVAAILAAIAGFAAVYFGTDG